MDWTLKEAEISEIASQLRRGRELPDILSRLAKAIAAAQEERRRETLRITKQIEQERKDIQSTYESGLKQVEEQFSRELARVSEETRREEPRFSIVDGCFCVWEGEQCRALFSLEELAGKDGGPGPAGARGRNATVNGVSALTLEADAGILMRQQGEVLTHSSEDHIENHIDVSGTQTEAVLQNNQYYNLKQQTHITLTMPSPAPEEGFHCMLDFTSSGAQNPVFICPGAFAMRGRDCADGVFVPKKGESYCVVFYVNDGCRGVVG